jgi:cytosine/adenosine deaminase-related metal-dependent hydrolase
MEVGTGGSDPRASDRGVVLRGGFVVAMDASRTVAPRDVHIGTNGRIVAVLPAQTPVPGTSDVDVAGLTIIPGLVQAHLHLCQTLFRGLGEARPLLRWLRERIWPLEGAHDRDSMRASADLGIHELLRSGTTSVLDMGSVHHTDALFESARDAGIRYVGGKAMMDAGDGVPTSLLETTTASIQESDRLRDTWEGAAGGRLRHSWCPRFVLSCTTDALRAVADRSRATGGVIHTHASEQPDEAAIVRAAHGAPNIATLARLGISGTHAVFAHGVWPEDDEIALMARDGTHVVHCPSSNLKLGSGVAPVRRYLDTGVSIAIGADGGACSNTIDAWGEMRLAHLLASLTGGPDSVSAVEVFALATLGGARALGLEGQVGVIAPGFQADLVAVGSGAAHQSGGGDPYVRLVHSTTARDVRHVWVAGARVVVDGTVVTLDEANVTREADSARARVAARAGVPLT